MVNTSQNNHSETLSSWLDRGMVLLVGVIFSCLVMHQLIVKPMQSQMAQMNHNLTEIHQSMESLVGTRHDVYKTNDLLTMIRQQDRLIGGATSSFEQLSEVRQEITQLKSQLTQDQHQLADVQKTMQQFTDLKAEILAQQPALINMQVTWNELKTLQKELAESRSSLTATINTWKQIQGLHSELRAEQDAVKAADSVAGSLLDLKSKLLETSPDMLANAGNALDQLVEFQIVLDQQSQLVPQSLRNMETLGELEIEVAASINRVRDMRRDLLDFALLEQSIKDTMRVLAPVMELTQLRKLSVDDVREVAKNLETRRNSISTMQPNLVSQQVSQQGDVSFDFKPAVNYQWDASILNNSPLMNSLIEKNSTNGEPNMETSAMDHIKYPPAVDMPE